MLMLMLSARESRLQRKSNPTGGRIFDPTVKICISHPPLPSHPNFNVVLAPLQRYDGDVMEAINIVIRGGGGSKGPISIRRVRSCMEAFMA